MADNVESKKDASLSPADNTDSASVKGATVAAPLYITIGPPCCGKSTWLRNQQQKNDTSSGDNNNKPTIQDICLDDQPNVYQALDSDCFVLSSAEELKDKHPELEQTKVAGQSLLDRLVEPSQAELRAVCRYVAANNNATTTSRQELQTELALIHNNTKKSNNVDLASTLLQALDACQTQMEANDWKLPATVDLFCRQALFTPTSINGTSTMDTYAAALSSSNNSTNHTGVDRPLSAIDRAYETLRQTAVAQPVAWGNTNLRLTDYQRTLQIACDQQRPVRFVLFDATAGHQANNTSSQADTKSSSSSSSVNFSEDVFDLPAAGLDELMRRNLQRFLATGRYIPSTVLSDMLGRAQESCRRMAASILTTKQRRRQQQQGQSSTNNDTPTDLQQEETATTDVITRLDVEHHLLNALQFDIRPENGTLVSTRNNNTSGQQQRNRNNKRPWGRRGSGTNSDTEDNGRRRRPPPRRQAPSGRGWQNRNGNNPRQRNSQWEGDHGGGRGDERSHHRGGNNDNSNYRGRGQQRHGGPSSQEDRWDRPLAAPRRRQGGGDYQRGSSGPPPGRGAYHDDRRQNGGNHGRGRGDDGRWDDRSREYDGGHRNR